MLGSSLTLKLKVIISCVACILLSMVIATWMFWDYVEIERVGREAIYRPKHNMALVMLPGAGFCMLCGWFIWRLGRLAFIPALLFLGMGCYVAWLSLTLDISNHHLRVGPDEVYSEWGSPASPQSSSIDFRQCKSLALERVRQGDVEERYLVAVQQDGQTIRMPVNDLVHYGLKRIFANASAHPIELRFPDGT